MQVRALSLLLSLASLSAVLAAEVCAQAYPSRPIRMVVPWPPGGGTDIVARTVAQKIGENIGTQVIIDNRPGAAAIIGTDHVAKSAPDGYTILMGNLGPNAANAAFYKAMSYDVVKDFAPVSLVATAPYIMTVHPSVPAKSVKEFIDLARKEPGKLNFGSGGVGSPPYLAAELFNVLTGIKLTHIPYKGGSAHTTALLAGEVQMTMNSPLEVMPHARSGKLRPLAVTTAQRFDGAPELPTLAEAGVTGYAFTVWWGVLAPAGTPPDIVSYLHRETVRALQAADVKERMTKIGANIVGSTPQEFGTFIRAETDKWARVASEAKLEKQ